MINKLCIIGVGLIGGSLSAGLREVRAVGRVSGHARRQETLDTAKYLKLIDEGSTDIAAAIAGADVIVLAAPVGAYRSIFSAMKECWPRDAVVTDAGSTKCSVLEDARAVFGEVPANFVPGHPVAGTERSGPAAAISDLYRHRHVILTPTAQTDPRALATVTAMWEVLGAQVHTMSAEHHDEILALTSHLPHVIAYQLIETLARIDDQREVFAYAAGGLRDLTRIASSNPEMWADIIVANRSSVLDSLDQYMADLQKLRADIAANNRPALHQHFSTAKTARDRWIHTSVAQQ